MPPEVSEVAAPWVFSFGLLMVYVEFAYPDFAKMVSAGQWYDFDLPRPTRSTRLFGAGSCMLFALLGIDAIPTDVAQTVPEIWVSWFVLVIAHDCYRYFNRKPPDAASRPVVDTRSSTKSQRKRRSKKRK